MLMYRIEDEYGNGAYSASVDVVYGALDGENCINRHPNPYNDDGLSPYWSSLESSYEWLFGFSSLAQYARWFYLEHGRQWMAEHGLKLKVYSVGRCHVGHRQMVALRDEMELVEELCPTTTEAEALKKKQQLKKENGQ